MGRLWHNALAPQAGACMPTLTRRVTLGEQDMLAVAQIARPWWRWARYHGRRAGESGCWMLYHNQSELHKLRSVH